MDKKNKNTVLQILAQAGLLSKKQVENILAREGEYAGRIAKSKGGAKGQDRTAPLEISLVDVIHSLKIPLSGNPSRLLTEDIVMETVGKHLGIPFMKIDPLKLSSDVVTKIISKPYAVKHQLVPIRLDGRVLTVATSNPFERDGIEGIKHSIGYDLKLVISTKTYILKIITDVYGFRSSVTAAQEEMKTHIDLGNFEQYVKLKSISELDSTDQHVIKAVEYLLHYAYAQRVSDIHIEPKRDESVIRFRIDGTLHTINKMPKAVHNSFVSRIKTLARMDISEKRKPQDGRIKTDLEGKEIELRVSSLPVALGEKIVIRIFDPTIIMQDIDSLGFLERDLEIFKSFIAAPHGLILVTGPTGSGKTTTLYSALKALAKPAVNIATIEDPVEMIYEEFNQTSVQPQIGLTFAQCLRTILRQDPDIIMVGEIRDLETAENALQAALTGHLVLSTLHTNDAPSSIARLLDLGIPPFLINSTLIGVVAQRLVKRVCCHCAEQHHLSKEECELLGILHGQAGEMDVSKGRGCSFCRGTGYLGRAGVFEVLEMTEKIKGAVEERTDPSSIRKRAQREGFRSLRACAVEKMLRGVTTVEEIIRVTGVE